MLSQRVLTFAAEYLAQYELFWFIIGSLLVIQQHRIVVVAGPLPVLV